MPTLWPDDIGFSCQLSAARDSQSTVLRVSTPGDTMQGRDTRRAAPRCRPSDPDISREARSTCHLKLATSEAKSGPSGFSIPSPSAKRAKPVRATGAPTAFSASLTACATVFVASWMIGLIEQAHFLVVGLEPALDDLLEHVGGLAGILFSQRRPFRAPRSQHRARPRRGRADSRLRYAWRSADRAP